MMGVNVGFQGYSIYRFGAISGFVF